MGPHHGSSKNYPPPPRLPMSLRTPGRPPRTHQSNDFLWSVGGGRSDHPVGVVPNRPWGLSGCVFLSHRWFPRGVPAGPASCAIPAPSRPWTWVPLATPAMVVGGRGAFLLSSASEPETLPRMPETSWAVAPPPPTTKPGRRKWPIFARTSAKLVLFPLSFWGRLRPFFNFIPCWGGLFCVCFSKKFLVILTFYKFLKADYPNACNFNSEPGLLSSSTLAHCCPLGAEISLTAFDSLARFSPLVYAPPPWSSHTLAN